MNNNTLELIDWHDFANNYWEKKPVVLKNTHSISEHEIFNIIKKNHSEIANNKHMGTTIFNGKSNNVFSDYIPNLSDNNISSYLKKIYEIHGCDEYAIAIHNLEQYSNKLFLNFNEKFSPLYDCIGVPSGKCEISTFISNTKVTPFGIHKDTAGIFFYVVSGEKSMYAWPYEYFAKYTTEENAITKKINIHEFVKVEDHENTAIKLHASEGDIIYWPSSYWHVGMSDGADYLTLSFAFYLHFEKTNMLNKILESFYYRSSEQQASQMSATIKSLDSGLVNDEIKNNFIKIRDDFNSIITDKSFEYTFYLDWMNKSTGNAFTYFPTPNFSLGIAENDVYKITGNLSFVIIDSYILYSCTGRGFKSKYNQVLELILDYVSEINDSFSYRNLILSLNSKSHSNANLNSIIDSVLTILLKTNTINVLHLSRK